MTLVEQMGRRDHCYLVYNTFHYQEIVDDKLLDAMQSITMRVMYKLPIK